MDFELTEATAERDVLIFGELLVSKDDHTAVMENVLDGAECVFAQRLCKIHTDDFSSNRSSSVSDIHGNVSNPGSGFARF
jgi:hypothetical protein